MEIWFRPYEQKDKLECLEAFQSNIPRYFAPEEAKEFEIFLNKLATGEEMLHTCYYVAGVGNRIVGCGGFGDKENTDTITLAWGLIHHDFHKQGLGAMLLEYRILQLRRLYPDTPVYLDTTQFTFSFFEKYGFKTLKITADFYAPGMHRYDMVLKT